MGFKHEGSPAVRRRGVRPVLAVGAAALLAFGTAACGSSDNSTKASGAAVSTTAASTGASAATTAAKGIFDTATKGMVYSATDTPTSADQIEAYGDWRGPTTAPTPKIGANVQVIVCTKQSAACVAAAKGVQAAGKVLGWKVEVIDGAGTPQGFAQAFDTAFSRKADAVIGIAVPTLAVGDKLAQAKKKGIVTAVTGDIPPTGGETPYDAYVSFRMPLMETLLAYQQIAAHDGKAKVINFTDQSFPSLIESQNQFATVLKSCSGCKVEGVTWKITDAADPAKVSSIVSGALAKMPDATAINVPYAVGLPAVVQAVASAGKADQVKVLVKDGDPVGMDGVRDGSVEATAGASPVWAGWAITDQVVRGLAKKPYLKPAEVGLGVVAFTKDNAPASGDIDSWSGMPGFPAQYAKAWGKG